EAAVGPTGTHPCHAERDPEGTQGVLGGGGRAGDVERELHGCAWEVQVRTFEDPQLDEGGHRSTLALRSAGGQAPMAWKPPSTWTISPVVAGKKSESRATTPFAVGVWSFSSQPRGERSLHIDSRSSKPGIAFAASVFSGPADTRLTRIPFGPRSRAR